MCVVCAVLGGLGKAATGKTPPFGEICRTTCSWFRKFAGALPHRMKLMINDVLDLLDAQALQHLSVFILLDTSNRYT